MFDFGKLGRWRFGLGE